MPKRLTTEDHLARLRQLRASPDGSQTIPALEQLLKTPRLHSIVLKSAAGLAEQLNAKTVIPSLVAAARIAAGSGRGVARSGSRGPRPPF